MAYTFFAINDEVVQLKLIQQIIREKTGCNCITASSGKEAIEYFLLRQSPKPDLLIINLHMADMSGLDVVRVVKRADPFLPIIALVNSLEGIDAKSALNHGVDDVLLKPVNLDLLKLTCKTVLERKIFRDEIIRQQRYENGCVNFDDIVGKSQICMKMLARAKQLVDFVHPICFEGEPGTGKEVFARAIHGSGKKSGQSFVTINCRLWAEEMTEALLDSSVTDDMMSSKIEAGQKGTIFIQDPQHLTLEDQRKLLEKLKLDKGERHEDYGKMSVIFSYTSPVRHLFRDGVLDDALYNLALSANMYLVPIRDRREDIVPLAENFLQRHAANSRQLIHEMDATAIKTLLDYHWPGNVSQLSRVMQNAVLSNHDGVVRAAHILPFLSDYDGGVYASECAVSGIAPMALDQGGTHIVKRDGHVRSIEDMEAELIQYAIHHYKGRMTEVARRLGIGRSTLYRKIQDYHIKQAI